ncbi:MAG: trypsin-like peptidase domain-containing protein [Gemmatimonadales bacterium]
MTPLRALFLAWCIGCGPQPDAPPLIEPASAQSPAARSQHLDVSRRTAIVDAATRVAPSVLSVNVTSRRRVQSRDPFDFFSFFVPRSGEQVVQSWGTGFVLRSDGIIVTNQHVVENAETITVSLSDGTDLPATLVGEDPTTDIAVLKVDRQLPAVTIGSSQDLLIGEWVVAVGNPYSYLLGNSEPTVTAGVVSATGRNVLPNNAQPGLYLDMIQTDAAINPGNSGGPLTNAAGEVVGVNSFIFSSSGGSVGLGFAIPIERVLRVANELVKEGAVRRAWTGLSVAGASAMRDWKSQGGVAVTAVDPGGPAARAGFSEGMILEEANGRRLRNYLDWEAVKLDLHVGDTVAVRVKRGSSSETRRIITGDLPTVTAAKVSVIRGLEVITVTPGIQAERSLRTDRGALIYRITAEVSQATGLQEGDVVTFINRSPISSAAQIASLLESMRSGEVFRIVFERQGATLTTTLAFR